MKAYLYAGIAGIVLSLGVIIWVLLNQLESAHAETATVRAEFRMQLADSEETVREQAVALTRWQAAGAAQAEQVSEARADAARSAAAAMVMQARIAKLEGQDNGKLDCQALLAADLAAVCPGHAAALRLHADGL